MKKYLALIPVLLLPVLLLSGCLNSPLNKPSAADLFFAGLSRHCGDSFQGKLVSSDAVDAAFADKTILIHIRDCSSDEIRIPLHIGDDRSRTWIIRKTIFGLQLKHDHRHEDGSEDSVTQYGGETLTPGTRQRQEFPADSFSKQLFTQEGLDVSIANIWAMEIIPAEMFAYELRRPNRFFRLEFDLSQTVTTPPPAWGAE